MDPDRVKAVVNWPTPDSRKALLRFLGFANFYRRFIRNFSQLAAPLTALTSTKMTFRWSNAAEAAFTKLRGRFVSAPILRAPDPTRQFVVEVDASEVGVGAVPSQRATSDDKVHPCAFFSHQLSPAESNYDIGNRELLAVKLALEEWHHWLEGSGVPFIVWTDHKNLEYIQSAKRLNSRQARWALFFGRFDFSISYRPGSKNIKPDALSRIFDISDRPVSPECIIPERLVVSAVTWEIESKVRTALEGVTPPPGCPTGRLFVPEGLRSNVIQWGHCSNVACHPGIGRTMFLVKQRFWWRAMARDIREFVLACSVCARGKTSNRPPEGLLQPLSVPSRPWSHIALDFVTPLPPSLGNTVVLTVVDRFSKAAHFIPLPKLPSAKETAATVVDHVFRIHGLPADVVSDRGPQFVSKFWREFCRLLGATVSLSSGFHPQTNGQTERANQDLERVLRCLVTQNPTSWCQQLSWVEYAHNSLPVSLQSTGKVGWERREALLGGGVLSRFMGSRSHPHRILYVCVCVSRCLWVCVIEADSLQLRVITVGYIRSCHAVFLVRSLQCLPCSGRRLRSVSCSGFAIPEPCCFPGLRSPETHLPIASLRYPPLPTKSSTLVSLIVLLLVINSLFSATESSRLHCDISWTVENNVPVAKRWLSRTPENSLPVRALLLLLLPFIVFVQGRPESQSAGLWPRHRLNQPSSRIQRIEGP